MILLVRGWRRRGAASAGVGLAVLASVGCGGETGGSPNGIAGALTKGSIVQVSAFALTTNSATAQLRPTIAGDTTYQSISTVKGALYPTRNSKSFRVILKGAAADLSDISYYFDIYDGTNARYNTLTEGTTPADPTNPTSPTTVPAPFVATGESKPSSVAYTTIGQLYVKKVAEGIADTASAADLAADSAISPVYQVSGAYTYAQPKNGRSVREGVRNVIVQFFTASAADVQTEFETVLNGENGQKEADDESAFLGATLTNSYVFTSDIQSGKPVNLTSGFASNNGDNGLVDSNDLPVKVSSGLPATWGSVKFEAYEEASGLSGKGIVFTKIVNFADLGGTGSTLTNAAGDSVWDPAARTLSSKIRFANRQRVLKVYATCYDLADGTGVVISSTKEDHATYNAPGYAPLFIPSPTATTAELFSDGTFTTDAAYAGADGAAKALSDLQLANALSNVRASVPAVASGASSTFSVLVDSTIRPRFSYRQPGAKGLVDTTVDKAIANAVVGFSSLPPTTSGLADAAGYTLVDAGLVANAGTVSWVPSRFTLANKPYIPGKPYADEFRVTVPLNAPVDVPVVLTPDAGTIGGTVRGRKP